MTMLDDDLEARLRETFRAVAATVDDDVSATSDDAGERPIVLFVDDAVVPTRSAARRRRPLLVGGAAVAVAVAAAAAAVTMDRGEAPSVGSVPPSVSTPLRAPGSVEPTSADRIACRTALRRAILGMPVEAHRVPIPDLANAVSLASIDDPDVRFILVDDAGLTYRCSIDASASPTPPRPRVTVSFGPSMPDDPPSDGAVIDERGTSLSGHPDRGPGEVVLVGRVGPGVQAVGVDLPDGSRHWGVVGGGRFVVIADLGRDVPAEEERLVWLRTDGTEHSSRADLLDEETEFERCAVEAGCVDARVAALREGSAGTQQAPALADGIVTEAEYGRALDRLVACLVAAGTPARREGDGYSVSAPPGDDDGFTFTDRTCGPAHLDAISEVRALADAERRLAEG